MKTRMIFWTLVIFLILLAPGTVLGTEKQLARCDFTTNVGTGTSSDDCSFLTIDEQPGQSFTNFTANGTLLFEGPPETDGSAVFDLLQTNITGLNNTDNYLIFRINFTVTRVRNDVNPNFFMLSTVFNPQTRNNATVFTVCTEFSGGFCPNRINALTPETFVSKDIYDIRSGYQVIDFRYNNSNGNFSVFNESSPNIFTLLASINSTQEPHLTQAMAFADARHTGNGGVAEYDIWFESITLLNLTPSSDPRINATINNTRPKQNEFINISANASSSLELSTIQFTINFSTGTVFINYSVSGTDAQVSNVTQIKESVGHVINITTIVTTSIGETAQNSTLITVAGRNSINFSLFDEITELLIPGNSSINLISDASASNLSANDGNLFIEGLIPGEYRITYFATKYRQRDFYINVLNNSNQSLELYLLSIGNGTQVTFTVQDESGNDLNNATIRLKRYYQSTNSYRTVAMSRTNEQGDAIIDVDFNDAFYETLTTFKSISLRTIGARIITTTFILTLSLIADPFESIDAIEDLTTSLSFNNATQTFSFVFTDLTGTSRTGTIQVIQIEPNLETIVCTNTDTSSAATILCQVNTTNSTGTYAARGFITVGGNKILTNTLEILTGLVQDFKNIWGTQGVFFTILIAGTLGTLGALVSSSVGIILFMTSLLVVNAFGMTLISAVMYGFFIIVGGVIIYKMKS